MLYNLEELEQDVHEPVTVPVMVDMQSPPVLSVNLGMADLISSLVSRPT